MFVLPHTAISDKEIVLRLVGMDVFKVYAACDRACMRPEGSTKRPSQVLHVWYDAPDRQEPAAIANYPWRREPQARNTPAGNPRHAMASPDRDTGRRSPQAGESVHDPAIDDENCAHQPVTDTKGRWPECYWLKKFRKSWVMPPVRPAPVKRLRLRVNGLSGRPIRRGAVNSAQIRVKGLLLAANNTEAPDMLFNGRSGGVRLLTLADSGATGCIIGKDSATRMGLTVVPNAHGEEGFQCANEGTLAVLGKAQMPLTIQRYVGSIEVHVVDQLPSGIELILGSDWMKKERVVIDYDRMAIAIKRHGCSIVPINQINATRHTSFFARAVQQAAHNPIDPTVSAREGWKELRKAGSTYMIVNLRQSRDPTIGSAHTPKLDAPPPPPLPPVSAVAGLPALAAPTAPVDFDERLKANVPEHDDQYSYRPFN